MKTPQTTTTSRIPSTRETIDLVSDDEDDIVKKREPLTSPLHGGISGMPTTVTVRKNQTAIIQEDKTPNRPPPINKWKSPTRLALSISEKPTPTSQDLSAKPASLNPPSQNSFTQIPDSEGEDDDDVFGGDDFDFGSDDIPPSAKKLLYGKADVFPEIKDAVAAKDEDDNVVLESPIKTEKADVEIDTAQSPLFGSKRMYPSLPTQSSSMKIVANSLPTGVGANMNTSITPLYSSNALTMVSHINPLLHRLLRIFIKRFSTCTRKEPP
jgi:hypothetical protein